MEADKYTLDHCQIKWLFDTKNVKFAPTQAVNSIFKLDILSQGMKPVKLSYEQLKEYTNNFSKENYVGDVQFGKVYHGQIEREAGGKQHVVVKIWNIPEIYKYYPGDNELRLADELVLLRFKKMIRHPGMVKLYGFCTETDHLGIVYNFKPLDTVYNLLAKENFTWLQRIKVALGFARFLKFLHAKSREYEPFMVRNIDSAHIMLDEEYSPKLIDFGMITGGIFPDRTVYKIQYVYGCYGSVDPSYGMIGRWTRKSDVFAFGVVLLGLITKRVFNVEDRKSDVPFVYEWAREEYESDKSEMGIKKSKRSLVHKDLKADPDFHPTDGPKITRLAIRCVDDYPGRRPTMKDVIKCFRKLQVVKHHAEFLGVHQVFNDNAV